MLSFMEDWPPARRRRFMMGAAVFVAGMWAVVFMVLSGMTQTARDRVRSVQDRFDRVAPLVEEAVALSEGRGRLASMNPLAASQQVSRDLKLEKKLASVRPAQLGGGREGVQLFFESLDLKELYDLLTAIQDRSGLKIFSMTMTRRLDVTNRADIQFVLAR